MNRFDYMIKIQAIKNMTTQKARETTMRELFASPDNTLVTQYSWNRSKISILDQKYIFKCFTKAYQDFTGKNLPLFLSESIDAATTFAFTELIQNGVNYTELCDFFEFTPNISMKYAGYSKFLI